MLKNCLASLGIALCSAIGRVDASIIDDYTVGSTVVERVGPMAANQVQTGLDPGHVLGGSRKIVVGDSGQVGQRAEVDASAGELRFHVAAGLGYLRVTYGSESPLNLDLAAQGNAFQLDFADAVDQPPLWLTVTSPVGNTIVSDTVSMISVPVTTLPNGTKRAIFSFGWFDSVDLSNVSSVEMQSVRVGRDMTLKSLTVIPEPSSIHVVGLALCSIWRGHRKFAAGERGR
jgi:hypothetical protein